MGLQPNAMFTANLNQLAKAGWTDRRVVDGIDVLESHLHGLMSHQSVDHGVLGVV